MTAPTELMTKELTVQSVLTQGVFPWWEIHESGVTFKPECPEQDWLELVKVTLEGVAATGISHCRVLARAADIINFGEAKFGERHSQGLEMTRGFLRLNAKTIENACWVFGKIPEERRRVDTLSLSHHEAVAKLDPDEQNELLRTAEADGMSVAALKEVIRERHPGKPRTPRETAPRDPDAAKIEEAEALLAAQKVIDYFAQAEEEHGVSSKWTKEQKAPWIPLLQDLVRIGRRTAIKTHGKEK